MIFITTGTQEPFDRLLQAMDDVAANIQEEVIVQALEGNYHVKNMELRHFLDPKEFNTLFNQARLIVSHAGMGTILSALTTGRPLVVMPRIAKFGEHRNEHQLATAAKFKEFNYVRVADNVEELKEMLINLLSKERIEPLHYINKYASNELLTSLSNFTHDSVRK